MATGEKNLFFEIWHSRPRVCKHCKKSLGGEPRAHYFHHIYPKSTHPERRLDPKNVILLCMGCHTLAHAGKLTKQALYQLNQDEDRSI